ncbi:MAG: DNRLRE domain-containing protein, partial [Oscillospiraceae bacterium]
MHKIEQSPIGSTIVASKYPDFNFNTLPYLQISNHTVRGSLNETQTLLKFNVEPSICIDVYQIKKAILYLPIENCHPFVETGFQELELFRNTTDFFSHTATWNTKPAISLYDTINLETQDLSNGICIDITNLAIDWKENPLQNYGLTLRTPTHNLTLNMCKRGPDNSPKLIICY